MAVRSAATEARPTAIGAITPSKDTATGARLTRCMKNSGKNFIVMPAQCARNIVESLHNEMCPLLLLPCSQPLVCNGTGNTTLKTVRFNTPLAPSKDVVAPRNSTICGRYCFQMTIRQPSTRERVLHFQEIPLLHHCCPFTEDMPQQKPLLR